MSICWTLISVLDTDRWRWLGAELFISLPWNRDPCCLDSKQNAECVQVCDVQCFYHRLQAGSQCFCTRLLLTRLLCSLMLMCVTQRWACLPAAFTIDDKLPLWPWRDFSFNISGGVFHLDLTAAHLYQCWNKLVVFRSLPPFLHCQLTLQNKNPSTNTQSHM